MVKEIPLGKPGKTGKYCYFLLRKRNVTTLRAVELLAHKLQLPLKNIGYAGNKDKVAMTEQVVSVKGLRSIPRDTSQLKFLGKGNEPMSLGDLQGNKFIITVRNIDKKPKPLHTFINYFGEQRFSAHNVEVGRAIVRGDFKSAAAQIAQDHPRYAAQMKARLANNDYVGALRCLPKKLLMLYVHAYQSWLWNKTVDDYMKENPKEKAIPIIGFGTELQENKLKTIIKKLMKKENVTFRSFIIRKIPELSAEGDERALFAEVKNLKIPALEKDELNQGKKKVNISFTLAKGCYATEFIRQLFSPRAF